MAISTLEVTETVDLNLYKVLPADTLAEAGRKALLREYNRINEYKTVNESGEPAFDIHNIQFATHQMKYALKLLKTHYKTKTLRFYKNSLNDWSQLANELQNLDRLIDDLYQFNMTVAADQQAVLKALLEKLIEHQTVLREKLMTIPVIKKQRRFEKSLTLLVSNPLESHHILNVFEPSQVRHLLPALIYDQLAIIRAYDAVILEVDVSTLQKLHVEIEHFLYMISLFEGALGKQIATFTKDLRRIQGLLDQIHQAALGETRLNGFVNTNKRKYADLFDAYHRYCSEKKKLHIDELHQQWIRFNGRKVQQNLSAALLSLNDN